MQEMSTVKVSCARVATPTPLQSFNEPISTTTFAVGLPRRYFYCPCRGCFEIEVWSQTKQGASTWPSRSCRDTRHALMKHASCPAVSQELMHSIAPCQASCMVHRILVFLLLVSGTPPPRVQTRASFNSRLTRVN
ncbi:hypothetical protein MRB53_038803 [Persea americana]|nr:hypothetical protein MRB53_038803 [Persea americana]